MAIRGPGRRWTSRFISGTPKVAGLRSCLADRSDQGFDLVAQVVELVQGRSLLIDEARFGRMTDRGPAKGGADLAGLPNRKAGRGPRSAPHAASTSTSARQKLKMM